MLNLRQRVLKEWQTTKEYFQQRTRTLQSELEKSRLANKSLVQSLVDTTKERIKNEFGEDFFIFLKNQELIVEAVKHQLNETRSLLGSDLAELENLPPNYQFTDVNTISRPPGPFNQLDPTPEWKEYNEKFRQITLWNDCLVVRNLTCLLEELERSKKITFLM